jgi:arsenate reductase (glutaredoxin)
MLAYGLKKCSTCQNALKFLAERKVKISLTDYSEVPLSKIQVARWSKAVGGWDKLVNRSGYTWRGLPPETVADLTETKAVVLIIKYPSLIRRPLIEHDDGTVTVGFFPKIKAMF